MGKSSFFSGQPIFSQILNLIPESVICRLVDKHDADRYCKCFKTRDHLVAMLYACFHECTSLREITTGLAAWGNKLGHLGLQSLPRRSTLSDANARRTAAFFSDLYEALYKQYFADSPDSRLSKDHKKRLFIMDSTTMSMFSNVLKGAGCFGSDGRKKGGAKAHVLLDAKHNVPKLIKLSSASRNDRIFMAEVNLQRGDILVFDKGYQKFSQWQQWTRAGINWVTRINDNQYFEVLEEKEITEEQGQKGVCGDKKILLGRGSGPDTEPITVRLVSYYVPQLKKVFHYLTNNNRFNAQTVADIYEDRWQIETFFKTLKQNTPLKYFLGDNENAIYIQLWCSFIKDLLVKIIKKKLTRHWSFSNLHGMIRHHIMNYIDLIGFLNKPEDFEFNLYKNKDPDIQIKINFAKGGLYF